MQNQIKICHIISAFHRYDTRIFWKQCRSLAKEGYNVTLLANDNGANVTKEDVTIISAGTDNSKRFQRMFLSRRKLYNMAVAIDADIYQIHDPEILPLGLRLLRKGKPVVFDSHEDFPMQLLEKEWIPRGLRKVLSWLAESYYRKNLKKFSAVLSVTPHIVDSLKRATDNVHLITNYPIIEGYFNNFSEHDYMLKPSKLCYAGTIYSTSMQENILEALKEIENVCYTMVGTIEQPYLEILNKYNAWNKVEFVKRVPKEELAKIYYDSTIGIVLFDYTPNVGYRKGTLGNNKIFEYMHSALPIICTDFELWKNIIDKYKCGIYVNPHSIEEIRNAIMFLMKDRKKAYEMGQNGRRAILEEYNWNSQETVYLNIYRQIIARISN